MEIILKTTAKERDLENGPHTKRVKRFNDILKNIRNRRQHFLKRISYAKANKLSYEEFLELILSDEF